MLNYQVLIYCICHFQSGFLFVVYFGFLCLQVSSVSNFCPDTRGRSHLFRLTISVVLWGQRNTANKYHWRVWGVLAVSGHTRFAFAHSMCAFPVYTAQAPGCSAGEVSKASPGLHALPGSKPLRFRFSGTPQRHRLGLCFAPFPGPSSSSDQVLCERTLPGVRCILSPPQSQWLGFLGAPPECHLRFAVCLLWGADLLTVNLLADVNHP